MADAETGAPIAGVQVELKHRDAQGRVQRFTAATDDEGTVMVPWAILTSAQQKFCLSAKKRGYDHLRRTIATRAGMFGVGGAGERFLLAATGGRRAVTEKCALDIIEKLDRPKARLTVQVHFPFAEAELTKKGQEQALEIAAALKLVCEGDPKAQFVLRGHTDGRGSKRYNLQLSTKRAEAVVAFVKAKAPELGCSVRPQGAGESEPAVKNARSEADHARNRRVEIMRPR